MLGPRSPASAWCAARCATTPACLLGLHHIQFFVQPCTGLGHAVRLVINQGLLHHILVQALILVRAILVRRLARALVCALVVARHLGYRLVCSSCSLFIVPLVRNLRPRHDNFSRASSFFPPHNRDQSTRSATLSRVYFGQRIPVRFDTRFSRFIKSPAAGESPLAAAATATTSASAASTSASILAARRAGAPAMSPLPSPPPPPPPSPPSPPPPSSRS